MAGLRLIQVGYGNSVVAARVVVVVSPDSAPMKRLKDEARAGGKLVDATQGRRTRSILVTDTDHVILSALSVETIADRLENSMSPPSAMVKHDAASDVEEPDEPSPMDSTADPTADPSKDLKDLP